MAVLGKTDLLEKLKAHLGEDTSDEALSLIEDLDDTFTDLEKKTQDTTDWKQKYDENDKAWRARYRDRFFNVSPKDEHEDEGIDEDEKPKTKSFEELFEEVK